MYVLHFNRAGEVHRVVMHGAGEVHRVVMEQTCRVVMKQAMCAWWSLEDPMPGCVTDYFDYSFIIRDYLFIRLCS